MTNHNDTFGRRLADINHHASFVMNKKTYSDIFRADFVHVQEKTNQMPSENFKKKVVYLILADSARMDTQQWLESNVFPTRHVHALHWFFLRVSVVFDPPQREVMVDHKDCVNPVIDRLSEMWDFWIHTYKEIEVRHVVLFMPQHGAETLMCFTNDNSVNPYMPLSCSSALLHACKTGFDRVVFYFCNGTQAITQLSQKHAEEHIPKDGDEKVGNLIVTSFNGIEWSSSTNEGPTAASNYLKKGAPYGQRVDGVAKNFVTRFDIEIFLLAGKTRTKAVALKILKTHDVGPSGGRQIEWDMDACEKRFAAQITRRRGEKVPEKLQALQEGQSINVHWATKAEPDRVFVSLGEVLKKNRSGSITVKFRGNAIETIPYLDDSEYVLIDVEVVLPHSV